MYYVHITINYIVYIGLVGVLFNSSFYRPFGSRTNAKLMQDVSSFQIEPAEEISGDDLGLGSESSSSPSDDEVEPVATKKARARCRTCEQE
jgi:hypothetical protein